MYSWERHFREDKLRENPGRMPTFSSTLLDEIYRSIDEKSSQDLKVHKEKPATRQGGANPKSKTQGFQDDEEIASFRMACFVDKWMEKQVINENVGLVSKRSSKPFLLPAELDYKSIQQNDFLFFSSSSTSSDTSSGTLSSSSDTDFFGGSSAKLTRPKPLPTTSISPRNASLFHQHKNEYQNRQVNRLDDENLIKSKSRALNLKKVRQPISPGGRLTNFISSLFTNANGKKAKNPSSNRQFEDSSSSMERKSKSTQGSSTCSSASSFSRSCLSKYSPKSREKMRNGIKRSVRFHPVSVIVDEDCRPCGHKSLYDEGILKFERPQLPFELIHSLREKNKKTQEAGIDFSTFKNLCDSNGNVEGEEDEDDGASDSSSDLFELDHLALLGNNRFCEELPVYETTHLHTNRAIASGLIS